MRKCAWLMHTFCVHFMHGHGAKPLGVRHPAFRRAPPFLLHSPSYLFPNNHKLNHLDNNGLFGPCIGLMGLNSNICNVYGRRANSS